MAEFATSEPLALQEAQYSDQISTSRVDSSALSIGGSQEQAQSTAVGDADLDHADATLLIGLQVWSSHSPWRIAAGWSAIAGILSIGLLPNLLDWQRYLNWQMLALMLLLADPLWGSIWRFAWGRDGLLPLNQKQRVSKFWMPYLRLDSPAGRLFGVAANPGVAASGMEASSTSAESSNGAGEQTEDFAPTLFRAGLPTILVALGIAATLDSIAIWFTGVVIICAVFGWLGRRTWGKPSAILQNIVTIVLPWVLAVYLLQSQLPSEQLQFADFDKRQIYSFCLIGLWAIHCLGISFARRNLQQPNGQLDSLPAKHANAQIMAIDRQPSGLESPGPFANFLSLSDWVTNFAKQPAGPLLIMADIGIIVLLLVLREPLWLAILTPLWLPTWLAYHHGTPVDHQPVWRLVAFLISAIAIGQTPLG